MSALRVSIQRKEYAQGPTLALSGVEFQVEAGQFVAILGPSGAGKSSLLNIVAGLDEDFEGALHLDSHATPVGVVFQNPRLMPWLSVLDNIRLVLGGDVDDDTEAGLRRLLQGLGLEGFEEAFPGQLSGGMQRRVGLARAFAVRPRLLLMDEPFVSLDDPLAWRLRDQLMDLWSELRPTVLYVTHDLVEALSLADRVLFMSARPGRVMLDETVHLPRPRHAGDPGVADLKRDLLARHPGLLSGFTEAAEAAGPATPGSGEGCATPREAPAA